MKKNESIVQFKNQTSNVALERIKKELDVLVQTCKDEEERGTFKREMDDFLGLFARYLNEAKQVIEWEKIQSPSDEQIIVYSTLSPVEESKDLLSKLCVLKLNGGLGTTMGCVGPKSAIEVRGDLTFLDLTVRQIDYLNEKHGTEVPLILMNSFNTDSDTKRIIQKYSNQNLNILTFNQSRYPRFGKDSLLPLPGKWDDERYNWFPPGHGDLYESLDRSGLLDSLIAQGKEYLFVSNIDNLGATVDLSILSHMDKTKSEFIMEVTDKTRADIKGGTLINYEGNLRLLEIAQVPSKHVDDFKSISKFKIFNTNNLWISLKAIKRIVQNKELSLEIIVNPKNVPETGEKVTQLETAVGAAIKHFKNAYGINVPRSRFLPVKGTSDLFLVQSDLFKLEHGTLSMNPKRNFHTVPLIKLGNEFNNVRDYLSRFKSIPQILELDHLTVTGDVHFGPNVTLKGTVIIVANHGSRIDIPAGSILENKIVSGNLWILDH
jgi:UTP--glucose-1-phosphate uridylyltransferase